MTVLAIGGPGRVGSLVVEALAARGLEPRVLTRGTAKARLPGGATAVPGDTRDPDSRRAALVGVGTLFLLDPVTPDEATRAPLTLELATAAGVRGVVCVSMVNADVLPDVPHAAAKHAAERLIAGRGLPATVLRNNYFMQNDALREPLLRDGVLPMPIGSVGAAAVDVRDVAAVAALEVARRHGAEGALPARTIDVSGPEVLNAEALCGIWTEALGRPVRYGGDDLVAFERRVAGQFPEMALDIALMFRAWQRIGVLPRPGAAEALAAMLGRPLRTYCAFAPECAAQWKGTEVRQ